MTSPSRKKHPITASNLRRKENPDTQLDSLVLLSRFSWFGSARLAHSTFITSLALVATLLAVDVATAQQQAPEKFARPKRSTPPVHAAPGPRAHRSIRNARPIPTAMPNSRSRQNTRIVRQQQQQTRQQNYSVRQVAAQQEIQSNSGGSISDQWRTRDQARPSTQTIEQTVPRTNQELRSVIQRPEGNSSMPQLIHPSPQTPPQSAFSRDPAPTFEEVPTPDATLGDQIPAPNRYELQQPVTQDMRNPIRSKTTDQFSNGTELQYDDLDSPNQNIQSGNSLRDLRIEPRRMRDTRRQFRARENRPTMIPSNYRGNRYQEDGTAGGTDYAQDFGDDEDESRGQKSCDEYREELLDSPITDIVVDFSPYQPTSQRQAAFDITRTWTDCNGTTLATGTLARLEQNYVVITENNGDERKIPRVKLSDGDLAVISEYWGLPIECTLGCYAYQERQWAPKSVFWKASALCHKPLYFENRELERYGHTHGPIIEPIHSSAHFFTSLILWPYNTGINPVNECQYALGFYRPGDCAPWLKEPFPISLHGFARQAAFVGVAAAILP